MCWAGGRARALTGILCGVRKCWERLGEAVIRGVTSLPVAHPRDLRMVSTTGRETRTSIQHQPRRIRNCSVTTSAD